jgi:hypothetical protein
MSRIVRPSTALTRAVHSPQPGSQERMRKVGERFLLTKRQTAKPLHCGLGRQSGERKTTFSTLPVVGRPATPKVSFTVKEYLARLELPPP